MRNQNVVFRKWPDGQIIAFLCNSASECAPGCVTSYMHVGQHGDASRNLERILRRATAEEYAPLLREMSGIYAPEFKIVPVRRLTS